MTDVRRVITMNTHLPRLIGSVALMSACALTAVLVFAQTSAQKTFATPEEAVKALVQAGCSVREVRPLRSTLEELFAELTG